jgi:DNA-binding response OmpR family regulator/nucleoid DNA-binding protein
VTHALETAGYNLTTVADDESAMSVAEESELIIVDLQRPGTDTLNLIQDLKHHPRLDSIPLLILTDSGAEVDTARAFVLGVNDFLLKPFSSDQLRIHVKHLFQGQRSTSGTAPTLAVEEGSELEALPEEVEPKEPIALDLVEESVDVEPTEERVVEEPIMSTEEPIDSNEEMTDEEDEFDRIDESHLAEIMEMPEPPLEWSIDELAALAVGSAEELETVETEPEMAPIEAERPEPEPENDTQISHWPEDVLIEEGVQEEEEEDASVSLDDDTKPAGSVEDETESQPQEDSDEGFVHETREVMNTEDSTTGLPTYQEQPQTEPEQRSRIRSTSFVEAFAEVVRSKLAQGQSVEIPGLGELRVHHEGSHVENRDNGQVVVHPPLNVVNLMPPSEEGH